MIEQRSHPRTPAIYPLRYRVPGLGWGGAGRTRDLSPTGVQFYAERAIEPGTVVHLRIARAGPWNDALLVPASVVRCARVGAAVFAIACALD